jgi:hypothetical protein
VANRSLDLPAPDPPTIDHDGGALLVDSSTSTWPDDTAARVGGGG